MNSPTTFACLLLLGGPVVLAQEPLRITGLDTPAISWVQNIEDAQASVRYDELAGESTLLFVHTTIDETVAGPLVTAGIISALPFLASPTQQNWQLTAPELAAMSQCNFTGEQPMVPPRRLANHIATFIAATHAAGYGTSNSLPTGYVTQTTSNSMVAMPSAKEDERWAWANSLWTWQESINASSFDTAKLGRESVFQAAYEFVAQSQTSATIDDAAIAALNMLLDSKLGFEIYIQAAHITPSSGGNSIEVRISRHARVRRRSLQEMLVAGWTGPDRYAPHPLNANINIWLAPTGDAMHVIFPREVGTLADPTTVRAYVPTTNGLVTVQQTANPIHEGALVRPEVGIFQCPPDMVPGVAYFELITEPGVPLKPVGTYNQGALIWPFTPPETSGPHTGNAGSNGTNPPLL